MQPLAGARMSDSAVDNFYAFNLSSSQLPQISKLQSSLTADISRIPSVSGSGTVIMDVYDSLVL